MSDPSNTACDFPFVFPVPDGGKDVPVWDGQSFRIGPLRTKVLAYEVGQSGWTDELTTFHEETAGVDHYIDRASRRHTLAQLRKSLSAATPVLIDIGCSSGIMLELLRDQFPAATLLGADYIRGPLEALAAKLPGVPLIQFDLMKCPLPDKSVDGIVLLNVLEHIERDEAALTHIARILTPGGVVVIEVPAGPGLYDVYDKLLLHHRRYRMADLTRKVEHAGLEIVEKSHLGFFLYPAFWLVKKRGRRYLNQPLEAQKARVSGNITAATSHAVMHRVMSLEASLRRQVYYPFGIRCLLTCRKPEKGPAVS